MNEEQSEIIVLIFRLKVANYGNFIRGLVTKYGVAADSWLSPHGGKASQAFFSRLTKKNSILVNQGEIHKVS